MSSIKYRELFREYGPVAIGVYSTLSFTVFISVFTTISIFGSSKITDLLKNIKTTIGIKPNQSTEAPEKPIDSNIQFTWLPEWTKTPAIINIGTNVLLSMAITKLFLPFKVGLTAYLTPKVALKLRNMGFHLNIKGGLKDAGSQIRQKFTDRNKHI